MFKQFNRRRLVNVIYFLLYAVFSLILMRYALATGDPATVIIAIVGLVVLGVAFYVANSIMVLRNAGQLQTSLITFTAFMGRMFFEKNNDILIAFKATMMTTGMSQDEIDYFYNHIVGMAMNRWFMSVNDVMVFLYYSLTDYLNNEYAIKRLNK